MNEDQTLTNRLEGLEKKVDRYFGYLFQFLAKHVASDLELRKRVAEFFDTEPGHGYDPGGSPGDDSPDHQVFKVDADENGKFKFDPKRWDYKVGDELQWVSDTGRISIHLNEYEEGLPSPFEGLPVVKSEQDEDGKWRTKEIKVTSVFSEQERTARRLSGAGAAYYKYVVALQKDGEVLIDTSQNGTAC